MNTSSKFVTLPRHAAIINVGEQDGQLILWAVVDTDQSGVVNVPIEVYGTGAPMERFNRGEIREHIKTVQMINGDVWHIFKIIS